MSSARCLGLVLMVCAAVACGRDRAMCPHRRSLWDKWYDGCNWCVCTESGPSCTDKSCHRIPVDRCELPGEKWRDGCYRCQCQESGIVCIADHRCVHAMRHQPITCRARLGCVCGIDGVPSCIADNRQLELALGHPKRHHDNKYVSNMPHLSKDRYISLTQEMSCRDAKRWYSGSKRCFCADDNEAKCGEPRHLAHRVDGYRFKLAQCYNFREWKVNCKTCKCQAHGFGFCVRIPDCKRNSLSETIRHIPDPECSNVGASWQDGCKYCRCLPDNRVRCDSFRCNLSRHTAATEVRIHRPTVLLGETHVRVVGGGNIKVQGDYDIKNEAILPAAIDETVLKKDVPRFQIPPAHTFNMVRSFRKPKPQAVIEPLCEGKYKVGESFYIKCNFCKCGPQAVAKCTAIQCVN